MDELGFARLACRARGRVHALPLRLGIRLQLHPAMKRQSLLVRLRLADFGSCQARGLLRTGFAAHPRPRRRDLVWFRVAHRSW